MAAILVPGRTCWKLDRAERASCIQDGADYFRLVREAMLQAERTIFILGWDTSGRTNLLPGAADPDAPTYLDELVRFVARRRPSLRCYILTWDYGSLYTLERDPLTRYRLGWRTPRNVTFGYDDHHPWGASHHQKVVVVDDRLAFSGSIDLTGHRWDTPAHALDDPGRVTPTGKTYEPYHEVQIMVEGGIAASLGELARNRWRVLGARKLPALQPRSVSLWPSDVRPDFTDVTCGISRTVPGSESEPEIRECEAQFIDSIAAAKRFMYIENQYFTSRRLADAVAARLAEPDGPEVIVVTPKDCQGWLERSTMGAFRDEVFRTLQAADAHRRLRLVHPLTSRSHDVSTFIHSKVMVVDDTFVRIGSANFSNRSLGMDTECDVSVEARGGPDDPARGGVRAILCRLLAEHFGATPEEIEKEIAAAGSLRAVIDNRAGAERTLDAVEPAPASEETSDTIRSAADPEEPIGFGAAVDRLLPLFQATSDRSHLRLWILPAAAIAATLLVAWSVRHPSGPEWLSAARTGIATMTGHWETGMVAAVFVVAAWCLVPLELCIVAAAFALGPVRGAVASMAGAMVAATTMYAAGLGLGPARLSRWLSPRVYRIGRQLCGHGTGTVAMLRLATVATASSIHLLCGAGRVRFGSYLAGTAIGIVPAVAALSVLGGLLQWTLLRPTIATALVTVGFAALLAAVAFAFRTFLLIRQFAPIRAAHRNRAEFG